MKRIIKIIVFVLLFLYILACGYLYFNQKSMIYFPNNQDFYDCSNFLDYKKEDYKYTKFYIKEKSENLIIYFHGNASSACDNTYLKDIFEKTGYSIIFVEYSGYYKNSNKIASKENILNDAENISEYVKNKNLKKVIVYGRSIGTGIASYYASISKVNKLILVTPFSSFEKLSKYKYPIFPISHLLTENYDNISYLKNYKNELLVLHGTKDEVIPTQFGKELFDSINSKNKKILLLDGLGHNNITNSKIFFEEIDKFIEK